MERAKGMAQRKDWSLKKRSSNLGQSSGTKWDREHAPTTEQSTRPHTVVLCGALENILFVALEFVFCHRVTSSGPHWRGGQSGARGSPPWDGTSRGYWARLDGCGGSVHHETRVGRAPTDLCFEDLHGRSGKGRFRGCAALSDGRHELEIFRRVHRGTSTCVYYVCTEDVSGDCVCVCVPSPAVSPPFPRRRASEEL